MTIFCNTNAALLITTLQFVFARKPGWQNRRAGNGNRTRMASLEGWNFTIKLCPRSDVEFAATTRDCQAVFVGLGRFAISPAPV